jgi:hypothetical protein
MGQDGCKLRRTLVLCGEGSMSNRSEEHRPDTRPNDPPPDPRRDDEDIDDPYGGSFGFETTGNDPPVVTGIPGDDEPKPT